MDVGPNSSIPNSHSTLAKNTNHRWPEIWTRTHWQTWSRFQGGSIFFFSKVGQFWNSNLSSSSGQLKALKVSSAKKNLLIIILITSRIKNVVIIILATRCTIKDLVKDPQSGQKVTNDVCDLFEKVAWVALSFISKIFVFYTWHGITKRL